jgi:glyoxylase-like metal-dependent hydrolase (beta-lactamase superfamily II)
VFSKYPWPERDAKYDVAWQSLKDDDIVLAGDDELQVVHTPGHAPDHIALWHRRSKTLFSGDLVVPGTTVVILATHGGSLAQYLASLIRVEALAPVRLLPAHGEAIDDPVSIIRRYIVHRLEREGQILAALSAGLRTVDAIVERIYVGLGAPLVAMARESVLAHLIKLQDEARVTRVGEEWRIG